MIALFIILFLIESFAQTMNPEYPHHSAWKASCAKEHDNIDKLNACDIVSKHLIGL